jgi:lipopolysaccharide/colanic/teichoic acid biosynthesis glycosyltransferase
MLGSSYRSRSAEIWFQLIGAIILAAVIPFGLRVLFTPDPVIVEQLINTLIGSILAIAVGTWLFRSFSSYPGVTVSIYTLPCFCTSFGLLLMGFVLGRLDYNRLTLIAGFILCIIWFYAANLQRERLRLRIGILPFGAVEPLRAIDVIDWVDLKTPDADHPALDAIVADLRSDLPSEWDRRLADWALDRMPVFHFKQLREALTGQVELEHLSENHFGTLTPSLAYMTVKHVIDWIIAVIAGVILLPLLIIVAILVRADSPGAPIFRQRRVGSRGVPFTVYKFRTMVAQPHGAVDLAADQDDTRVAAMTQDGDARITRLGRFLRKSRIDELPQILNIILGEMSWIGPRPEAEILSRWYEAEIPFYRYRHIVRPGVTGWAQVSQGHVADVEDVKGKLNYDFYYVKNYSAWLDVLIVIRTIRTILTGFGSK